MSLLFRLILLSVLVSPLVEAKSSVTTRPIQVVPAPSSAAASFPGPPYPLEALQNNIQGVVQVSVRFDEEGRAHCRVMRSSGSDLLDDNTVNFIRHHWIDLKRAGQTIQTPITYRMQAPPVQPSDTGSQSLEQILAKENFTWVAAGGEEHNADTFDVKINGKKIPLTLDTGAAHTIVSRSAVNDADLTVLPNEVNGGVGINGAVEGPAYPLKLDSIQIGKQSCILSPITVEKLSRTFRRDSMCEGLLGLPFLKANHAVIVVNPPVLFLNPSKAASSALDTWLRARGSTVVPLKYVAGHYLVPVRLDGFATDMVLDTGAGFTLLNSGFLTSNHFDYNDRLG